MLGDQMTVTPTGTIDIERGRLIIDLLMLGKEYKSLVKLTNQELRSMIDKEE